MKIGKYDIPVRNANFCSIGSFSAGAHGKKEKGDYCFWTAIFRKNVDGKNALFGRSRAALPPTDRFDRMKKELVSAKSKSDRKIYKQFWMSLLKRGGNVKYVRPAKLSEVKRWLKSHKNDGKHLKKLLIAGRLRNV
jgi:hypothetical protein